RDRIIHRLRSDQPAAPAASVVHQCAEQSEDWRGRAERERAAREERNRRVGAEKRAQEKSRDRRDRIDQDHARTAVDVVHGGTELAHPHQVSGVAQVQVLGGQKYAMHAELDPHALAVRQIGINEVETALRNWNVNVPTGSIVGPHQVFTLQASGQLMNADQYRNQIISYRNNLPVRLEQLGTIVDGVEDQRTGSWYYTSDSRQSAITLGIQRQPGTNTIAVSDAVKALLPQFRAELPA